MMSAYSEDLRRRIVCSVEGVTPKAQAARTFSVSLSSAKKVREQGPKGTIPCSEEKARIGPKFDERAMKLLREDLAKRPFATLRELCEYVEVTTGLWVSRSTMCRAIARLSSTRKKGGDQPPSATGS